MGIAVLRRNGAAEMAKFKLEPEKTMSATATMGQTNAKLEANAKSEAERSGRDGKGRFTAGNKGGPGNPFSRQVAALRRAVGSFVSEDDLKHIVFVVKTRAEGGDMAAAKLPFPYVLGK